MMEIYRYRVDKITLNRYMGNEYTEARKGRSCIIFLLGIELARLAPELQINIGDIVEIKKDEKFSTKSIAVI